MAARKKTPGDDAVLDADADDAVDAFEDDDDELIDSDEDDADDAEEDGFDEETEPELDDADDEGLEETALDDANLDGDTEDDEPVIAAPLPPEAEFDEDDGEIAAAVAGGDVDDDNAEIEGLRDGEFVCRSCFMAKRETQLADADRLICRDCA